MIELVVSRYSEDVSWLSENFKYIVYNKGDVLDNSVPLPNIGREAQTYLHHIINNFNNLPEITVFTQGNPHDHCKNIIDKINNLNKESKFVNFCDRTEYLINLTCKFMPGGWNQGIQNVYYSLFSEPELPDVIEFGAGAIFAVHRNIIKSRSIDFYKKALEFVQDSPFNGDYAHALERLWVAIFDPITYKSKL